MGSNTLILDCRTVNQLCRQPPRTHLSSPGGLSRVRFASGIDDPSDSGESSRFEGSVSALDLVDSFYQLLYPIMCQFFSFCDAFRADELNVSEAVGPDGKLRSVDGSCGIFAGFQCLPMGWAWALHVCHMLLVQLLIRAMGLLGYAKDAVYDMLVLDGRPAPTVDFDKPALAPYVDNCNIITATREEGSRIVRAM